MYKYCIIKNVGFVVIVFLMLGGMTAYGSFSEKEIGKRTNVLLITVDDLRPELGCYGNLMIKSPNIDRLAKRGMVFEKTFCQDAVCSPSRTSMLTGLRPDTTQIYDNDTHFRTYNPNVITLPQQFRRNGYHSLAMGKVYHSQWDQAYVGRRLDDPPSWSEPAWFPSVVQFYFTPEGKNIAREIYARTTQCKLHQGGMCVHSCRNSKKQLTEINLADPKYDEWKQHFVMGLVTEAPDVPDDLLYDGQVASRAISTLRRLQNQPFFMAVGFIRPHIPSVAPKRYWDLYEASQFKLADSPLPPRGAPAWTLPNEHDHSHYCDIPLDGAPLDDNLARRLIHGYYATVSFMDAQVGRVLAELDLLGLSDNTIVVLWGDHGYHLGENSRWGKQTCYEMATRQPLIIAVPGMKNQGSTSPALVEAVDIYPTLCELADLPLPTGIEGVSMTPLLDDPGRPWKTAVFSQYPRPVRRSEPGVLAGLDDKMGYAIRTERYRYVEWHYITRPGEIAGCELYDHQVDPTESVNLADQSDQAELVQRLHEQLQAGWRKALPSQK